MKMDTIGAGRSKTRQRSSRAKLARGTKPRRSRGAAASQRKRPAKSSARGRTTARTRARGGRAQARSARGGGSAKSTTDLKEIRRWAESRGGKPVSVIGTARRGGAGLLRIDFPGYSGAGRFEEISWDEWYEKFQESGLEFLYQDRAANGGQSRFFKLVQGGTAKKKRSNRGASSKASSGARSKGRSSKGRTGSTASARRSSRSNSRSRARSR